MKQPRSCRRGLTRGEALLILFFLVAGLALGGWTVYRQVRPPDEPTAPNIAAAAQSYLRVRKKSPTQEKLDQLLAAPASERVPTQPHPLLHRPAPSFELHDQGGASQSLAGFLAKGPVLLVFYYGYHCDHCVSQLFDLNEDLALFDELGVTVVAISGDPSEHTAAMFRKHGAFRFPVLADAGNRVAESWGCYHPASQAAPESLDHGTFVLDRAGVIRWAYRGDQPFVGIKTLVHELHLVK